MCALLTLSTSSHNPTPTCIRIKRLLLHLVNFHYINAVKHRKAQSYACHNKYSQSSQNVCNAGIVNSGNMLSRDSGRRCTVDLFFKNPIRDKLQLLC
jgi:hypothetical protein